MYLMFFKITELNSNTQSISGKLKDILDSVKHVCIFIRTFKS